MIDFLLGVPGKLTALAAQITGLGSPASQTSVTALGSPAQAAAVTALGSPAQSTDPRLAPPIATNWPVAVSVSTNLTAEALSTLGSYLAGSYSVTTVGTTDTTLIDYTGAGVVNLLAVVNTITSARPAILTLVVDGVVLCNSVSIAGLRVGVAIGAIFPLTTTNGTDYLAGVAFDHIPFRSSLVIKLRSTAASQSIATLLKLHRTA